MPFKFHPSVDKLFKILHLPFIYVTLYQIQGKVVVIKVCKYTHKTHLKIMLSVVSVFPFF